MDDESTVLEEIEEVEAVPEAEEAAETTSDDETDVEESTEEETEEEETVEFDFGGNKMSIPKGSIPEELAAEIDKFTKGTWGDYTRKSQEVAEQRKAVEAREKAVERFETLNNDVLEVFSRGLSIRNELEQLRANYDLSELWQSDPDLARRVSDTVSQKQAELQRIASDVSQKESALTQAQQAELARRTDEGKQVLERRIKGFEAQHLPAVLEYAEKALGIPAAQAKEGWALNPAMTEATYKAMLYDRMQEKAKAKPKPAPEAPVKPIKGAKAKRSFDLVRDADKMSADEWLKRRNAQVAKR